MKLRGKRERGGKTLIEVLDRQTLRDTRHGRRDLDAWLVEKENREREK